MVIPSGYARLPYPVSRYTIDPSGNVLDLESGRILEHKLGPNSSYVGVTIWKDDCPSRSVTMHLHRLLAMAFIPNTTGLAFDELHVNHIDGNKLNNELSNLEWVTRSGNCFHAYQTGLRPDNRMIRFATADRPWEYQYFYSQAEAARFLGLNPASLCEHMKHPVRKTEPYHGYLVSYCDEIDEEEL